MSSQEQIEALKKEIRIAKLREELRIQKELEELRRKNALIEAELEVKKAEKELRKKERQAKRRMREEKLNEQIANTRKEIEIAKVRKEIEKGERLMRELEKMEMGMKALDRVLDVEKIGWEGKWALPEIAATVTEFILDPVTMDLSVARKRETTIQIRAKPFAKGAFRFAYYCKEGSKKLVLKELIHARNAELDFKDHQENVRLHLMAKHFAEQFNLQKPSECPSMVYEDATIYQFTFEGKVTSMFAENLIEGSEFIKYNNNVDYAKEGEPAPQTFSHFTYQMTCSKIPTLICDIQGIRRGNQYILTDPACHKAGTELKEFIGTNMGEKGIKNFFSKHICNGYCNAMKLSK